MKKLLTILLLLVVSTTLAGCNGNKDLLFEIIGDEVVQYTTLTPYIEKGFIAKDNFNDISESVEIFGNVDSLNSGNYKVTYTLSYKDEIQILERFVYYREQGCSAIHETNLTGCDVQWSQYLNTFVQLQVYYEDDEYHDNVQNIFSNIENILSDYHELSGKYDLFDGVLNVTAINNDPTTTHTIDSRLFDLIKFSLDHQDDVDNLFNIALGPVLKLWHDSREACTDFDSETVCALPVTTALQAADQFTDPSLIVLDEVNKTITMGENMSIDLGGVSKGYISKEIITYLDNLNLSAYLLNNGTSNISIGGTHPVRENGLFKLAITDPTGEEQYYALVYLGDGDQLVTSGDYQQYFTLDGVIYHHIINPNTLMPERTSRSVSIITTDAALADLYSTAIFTMTIEEGIEFVDSIDGLEGIWYANDDSVHFSANFEEMYLDEVTKN